MRLRAIASAAVGFAAVLAWSCVDLTHRDRINQPEVSGTNPTLDAGPDPRDSPDELLVQLGSPNPSTGAASVNMSTAYKFATYVTAVASGTVTKTIQYPAKSWYFSNPSGSVSYPANEIVLSRYDGTMNYRTVDFLGSTTTTFLMEGGASAIIGAARSGHGNGSYYGDDNAFTPNGLPRVYCGIEYGTSCFNYSGGPSQVVLTRLTADMTVTPEYPSVQPGATPYVDYRASPMTLTVNGTAKSTPFVPDSTHWIPDVDSLGGDAAELPTHAANTGACQPVGTGCRRKIIGSGTFIMNAFVNGKRITKTGHISAPDLILTASPNNVVFGDTVKFTPTWTDGTPITGGVLWTWMPNTSPGTTPACGSVVICRVPVRETGTMKITITRNGVVRTAVAKVDTRYRFSLTANPTSVAEGKLVTFTPMMNGQPTPASGWRWVPGQATWDTVAGCASGVIKCHRVMLVSGRMYAFRTVTPTLTDTAWADVTVVPSCSSLSRISRRLPSQSARDTRRTGSALMSEGAPCGTGGEGSAELDGEPWVKLHWVVSNGISRSTIDSSRRNTVIPYGVDAVPGYLAPEGVFIDSLLEPPSGALLMDHDHTIEADADSNYALNPGIADLRARLSSVIGQSTAAGKREAARAFIEWYWTASDAGTIDTLSDRIALAERLEFDVRNAADVSRLSAFESAMRGYFFELNMVNGAHVVTIIPPPEIVARKSANTRASLNVGSTSPKTTFVVVNGIQTEEEGLTGLQGFHTKAASLIFNDGNRLGDNKSVVYFWNRTYAAQAAAYQARQGCVGYFSRPQPPSISERPGYLSRLAKVARCTGANWHVLTRVFVENDISESYLQLRDILQGLDTVRVEDMHSLASLTRDRHADSGKVIFIPHSQGNLLVITALNWINDGVYTLQGSGRCTAIVGLAPPNATTEYPVDTSKFRAGIFKGDILTLPPVSLVTRNQALAAHPLISPLTQAADARVAASSLPESVVRLIGGFGLHYVVPNYFQTQTGTDSVKSWVRHTYDQCAAQ
jgi:hypothetical protein